MFPDFPLTQYCRRLCLARLIGLAAVATVYALIFRGHIGFTVVPILAVATIEGLCLGVAQASVLRRFDARPIQWIIATILGTVAGHGLGIMIRIGTPNLTGQAQVALWMLLASGVILGVIMGLLMAAMQAPSLPPRMRSTRWITINALAWIPVSGMGMLVAAIIQFDVPLPLISLAGAGIGALSGMLLGGITGYSLDRADLPLLIDHPLHET